MDKIKLNNQVVHMRKYVKQAKVHVINKLVKQVKLLQSRKGNEDQIQKAKRKAERFLELIALIKKIKPDHVSKLALSKAKDWKDILQQKNSSLEDRCIAMLANYNAVEKEVKTFHSSNADLVLKITDLVKQWDEKSKINKKLSGSNRVPVERKNDKKISKEINKNLLNNGYNEMDTVKIENQFASQGDKIEKNIILDSSHISSDGESKLLVKPPENIAETTTKILQSDSDPKSSIEIKKVNKVDTVKENVMETEESDISEESDDVATENTTKIVKSDLTNSLGKKDSSKDNDSEHDDEMQTEESDTGEESDIDEDTGEESDIDEDIQHDDPDGISDLTRSRLEVDPQNKNEVGKPNQLDVSEFINKMNSNTNNSEKKLKAIALLNLDELQGLDEIPVDKANERNISDESEEESGENETVETSKSKRNDPFFLGCGDEDFNSEEKSIHFSNSDKSKGRYFSFSDSDRGFQRENSSFKKKENSSEYNHKKNFQRFSNTNQNFRRDSAKFQNKRDNFRPFQKDKSMARNYQGKFETRSKRTFDGGNFKNQRDFKMKNKLSQNSRERKHEDSSNVGGSKFSAKPAELRKKDIANDKPLHPSWEAKRKQKELNTSFQGKRMVFND